MSRLIVRTKIREELIAFAAAHGIVYHDSIDTYLEVSDPIWITTRFESTGIDRACYSGEKIIESGNIEVIVFVKAGQSDIIAVGLCDELQDHFLTADVDPVGIESVNSASDFAAGDSSGKYWASSVDVAYFYAFQI